jgi:hypothetical protein
MPAHCSHYSQVSAYKSGDQPMLKTPFQPTIGLFYTTTHP